MKLLIILALFLTTVNHVLTAATNREYNTIRLSGLSFKVSTRGNKISLSKTVDREYIAETVQRIEQHYDIVFDDVDLINGKTVVNTAYNRAYAYRMHVYMNGANSRVILVITKK